MFSEDISSDFGPGIADVLTVGPSGSFSRPSMLEKSSELFSHWAADDLYASDALETISNFQKEKQLNLERN